MAFDTWIRNFDRYSGEGPDANSNLDNLLFIPDRRKSALVVIDHTHAFVEVSFDEEIADPHWQLDESIYGLFPNFVPFLDHKVLMTAIDKFRGVDIMTLEEIFERLPNEWQLTLAQRSLFAEQLFKRAENLSNWLPDKLFSQKELF